MNAIQEADILRAELDLLLLLGPILIAGVCALVATVTVGVWRLCADIQIVLRQVRP